MNNRESFKAYFDIRKTGAEVIARVYQEERNGARLSERIVHAENYSENRIEKDNWSYNKHAEAEKEATRNCFELARDGFNLIVWISPKSEIYEEGRLNIILPDGEAMSFDSWAVPLLLDEKESMVLADRLLERGGVSMDPIENVESLRRQPVGYKLKNEESWIERCREIMPEFMVIWDEIESGRVDKNMRRIADKVEEIKVRARGNNVLFEKEMARMGYRLNVAGDHGGSWLSQEIGRGIGTIATRGVERIRFLVGNTEGLNYCKKCGCWYSGDKCPICDKK